MENSGKVLIVDDEPVNVEVLALLLSRNGYEVVAGYNGGEALAIASEAMPDIILLDVNMPGMNGYEVTRKIKSDRKVCVIPVVLMTGADIADKVKGLEAGADDFLTKPINEAELSARIRSLIKLKRFQAGMLEHALQEEKEFAENLLQNARVPAFVLNTDHKILIWNNACEKLTGLKTSEMIGTDRQWLPFYGKPRPTLADMVIDGRIDDLGDYPACTSSPINPEGLQSEGWFPNLGGEKRYIYLDAEPIYNSSGKLVAVIETLRDITLRKKAEEQLRESSCQLEKAYADLKDTQARVIQQEKMASIGQLAAGVAHEINNPVGFIASNLNTLGRYLERYNEFIKIQSELIESLSDAGMAAALRDKRKALKLDYIIDDGRDLIKESLEGAERVKSIVQNMKSFSRMDGPESKLADINQCVISTVNIVWNELKYKASLIKELGDIPQTSCRPQEINQVFMNLLVNAAHAITDHGEITVRTWHENDCIYASVADTGCGIAPEIRERIFEPFFTTKEVGKGTGLGLSITYDIIKKHNGELTVASEPGKGTVFTFRIPVVEER